ncbi:MAG: hypothetical protein HW389_3088 [Bacteroidetes bacterium]|nr:hypothetical protein [Bacteroidota bacterium]MBM2846088.1 hypothetical protein [Bacteroidota bacterium]
MMTSDEIVSCSQVCFGVVPIFFCLFAISFGHQLLALFLLQTVDVLAHSLTDERTPILLAVLQGAGNFLKEIIR